ncbi:MAG: hypothetical protein QM730_01720 [Anaerolineales bacterium]
MRPALALPYNDPDGTMLPHLQAILPDLKAHFDHAYICPPLSTRELVEQTDCFRDDFFTVFYNDDDLRVGERFAYLYQLAAEVAPAEQAIHLCYVDRLSFALQGRYRDIFLADVDSLSSADLPLIFQRSPLAWDTHPQNYRDIEGMVTTVGRHLFGRELDYAWCHLVANAGDLRRVIPLTKLPNISMVAEIVYYLQDNIHTKDVDWLSWEDPFILERDASELKRERETSVEESQRRLAYAIPMIDFLTQKSKTATTK